MKKLVMSVLLLWGAAAGAAEAEMRVVGSEPMRPAERSACWTPVSLNLVTPVGLPWGFDWDVCGFQVGLWNDVPNFDGWQVGVVNVTENFRGWQLGVVNCTHKMYGVQMGVVNVIKDNDVPFLPVINCYF
ncbi:MAG: hypothetical protein IKP97_05475 [Kiritimatiellae bacterium]|nr:hypothetical protein [Kiritimatiellia bacterium]